MTSPGTHEHSINVALGEVLAGMRRGWTVLAEQSRALDGGGRARGHWEVLTLEASGEKLLAAETVKREAFEEALRARLQPLARGA